jgi:hypothetical protein
VPVAAIVERPSRNSNVAAVSTLLRPGSAYDRSLTVFALLRRDKSAIQVGGTSGAPVVALSRIENGAQPRLGLSNFLTLTQGSPALARKNGATLGFEAESLWDSKKVAAMRSA